MLLEAMACGKPVVATPVGGITEILSSDKLGILVERNEIDIAKGISNALLKDWNSQIIRQYAETHTWDRVSDLLHNVFCTVKDQYGNKDTRVPCE